MSSLRLILRRARDGVGLLLTILALVTATTAIIAGTVGYSTAAATVAARQALTGTDDPTEAGLRVQTRQGEDSQAQDTAARELIADAFAPAPVVVQRGLASEPRPVPDREERLQVVAGAALAPDDPDFAGRVDVVEGEWPAPGSTPTQGALHTGAATRWDLTVGDTLVVGDQEVRLTALWRPVDPAAAFWFGDPLASAGGTEEVVGPLVVDPAEISAFSEPPFVQWTVQPDTTELTPADLRPLAAAAERLRSTMQTGAVEVRGLAVEGDLPPTAARADRNLNTARALNIVPLMMLLAVCVIAVVQLARLLAAARGGQLEVFLARGASRRQVIAWSGVEAAVVAVVGAALGILIALGVLRAVPAGPAQSAGVLTNGVLTGLAVLLALLVVTVLQVRGIADRRATDRSGRTRSVAALGTLVLVLGAAALAWWQLRRYGSPLVTAADGDLRTDLVAGAAPTLLLGAVAVLALGALGPLGRVLERLTHPGRRLVSHLSATQVSRRLVVYAVPVVLIVLAVGATTLSGLYAATSADLRSGLGALGQGAQVRATLESRPDAGQAGRIAALPAVAEVPGVEKLAPIWSSSTDVGDTEALLVAAPLADLDQVAIVPDGAADPGALAELLAPATEGASLAIPGGTDSIELDVALETTIAPEALTGLTEEIRAYARFLEEEAEAPAADVLRTARRDVIGQGAGTDFDVSLLVRDPRTGVVQQVTATSLPSGLDVVRTGQGDLVGTTRARSSTVTVPVPGGTAYEVVGIELEKALLARDVTSTIDVGVLIDDARLPGAETATSWAASLPVEDRGPQLRPNAGGGLTLTVPDASVQGGASGRQPLMLTALAATDRLPLALTRPLAQANDLAVGSPVDIDAYGSTVQGEVAAVVDAVPGSLSPDVVLVDAGALSGALLTGETGGVLPDPSELWVRGPDPAALAEVVADVPGIATAARAAPAAVTDAATAVRLVFWVASAGSMLLAVTGVGAVAATLLAGRRSEVAVLRALGMTSAAQHECWVTWMSCPDRRPTGSSSSSLGRPGRPRVGRCPSATSRCCPSRRGPTGSASRRGPTGSASPRRWRGPCPTPVSRPRRPGSMPSRRLR